MAHQAHNIPWNSLAASLKYVYQHKNARGQGSVPDPMDRRTDLFLIDESGTGKLYTYFIRAFVNTVEEFIETERRKYPPFSEIQPFQDEEIFGSTTIAAIRKASINQEIPKMSSYLNQPKTELQETPNSGTSTGNPEESEVPLDVAAAVPEWSKYIIDVEKSNLNHWTGWAKQAEDESRVTSVETYTKQPAEHWGGYKMMSSKQERGDVATLCLYANQISPLLRLAKSPNQNLKELWHIPGYSQMFNRPSGLETALQTAVMPYIVLNLLYCKPELYTTVATNRGTKDYRLCSCYRAMVADAVCEDDHDYWAIPHRRFWGRGYYRIPRIDNKREKPILKNGVEVDPLGDGHAGELREYLSECWNTIVRSVMVGREWDVEIQLEYEILAIFERLDIITLEQRDAIQNGNEWKAAFRSD